MRAEKKTYECPFQCDQAASIKKHGRPCIHLERLLPGVRAGGRFARVTPDVDWYPGPDSPEEARDKLVELMDRDEVPDSGKSDESVLFEGLIAAGLSERKARVVVGRQCRGLSWREIAIEYGYASKGSAHLAYSDALKILKRAGFKGARNE